MTSLLPPDEQADLRTLEEAGTVLVGLDAVEVTLPYHPSAARRLLMLLLLLPVLASMSGLLLLNSISMAEFFFAGLLYLAWMGLLWRSLPRMQLRLTGRYLHTASRQIAMDDIQVLTYRYNDTSMQKLGTLEVALRDERIDIPMPGASAGPALVRLIRRHVERRRLALEAEGHDTSQPARPPEALLDLQRQRRS